MTRCSIFKSGCDKPASNLVWGGPAVEDISLSMFSGISFVKQQVFGQLAGLFIFVP